MKMTVVVVMWMILLPSFAEAATNPQNCVSHYYGNPMVSYWPLADHKPLAMRFSCGTQSILRAVIMKVYANAGIAPVNAGVDVCIYSDVEGLPGTVICTVHVAHSAINMADWTKVQMPTIFLYSDYHVVWKGTDNANDNYRLMTDDGEAVVGRASIFDDGTWQPTSTWDPGYEENWALADSICPCPALGQCSDLTPPYPTIIGFGEGYSGCCVVVSLPTIYWHYLDTIPSTQTSFEIEVGTNADWSFAEMWRSGVVNSSDTSVVYAGMPLENHQTYYLRVRLNNGISWGDWAELSFTTRFSGSAVIRVPTVQPTIQAGINVALDGDTVLVAPGTYFEKFKYVGRKIVVTSSDGPEVTIIQAPYTPVVQFVSAEPPGTELSGFTFRNTIGGLLILLGSNAQPQIRENVFENLTADPVIIFSQNSHPRITRNLFFQNEVGNACIGVASGAADIINNTFDSNRRGFYSYGATVAKNNIVTRSQQYGVYGSFSELNYNDVWSNGTDYDGGASPGEGSISDDPHFVDPSNHNYTLQRSSPCINAGDPDAQYNDSNGTRNDMGALAYQFPGLFSLLAPTNGIGAAVNGLLPTFHWTAAATPDSTDTVRYTLIVAVDSNFNFSHQSTSILSTSHDLGYALSWNQRYWWKVKATDQFGDSTWSREVFTFRTMTLGDANNDGAVDISDVVYLINYIFAAGSAPNPLVAGDADCDEAVDVSDAVYLIAYIFSGGPQPCGGL
jgi:hypothetical protein